MTEGPGFHPWDNPRDYPDRFDRGILPPGGGLDPDAFEDPYYYQNALFADRHRLYDDQFFDYTQEPVYTRTDLEFFRVLREEKERARVQKVRLHSDILDLPLVEEETFDGRKVLHNEVLAFIKKTGDEDFEEQYCIVKITELVIWWDLHTEALDNNDAARIKSAGKRFNALYDDKIDKHLERLAHLSEEDLKGEDVDTDELLISKISGLIQPGIEKWNKDIADGSANPNKEWMVAYGLYKQLVTEGEYFKTDTKKLLEKANSLSQQSNLSSDVKTDNQREIVYLQLKLKQERAEQKAEAERLARIAQEEAHEAAKAEAEERRRKATWSYKFRVIMEKLDDIVSAH